MPNPRLCANCGTPLPPDHPADNRYCAECTAKWQRAPATQKWGDPDEYDATQTAPGQCPNCGASLPPDHPAGNPYCARCSAHWWAGRAAREQREGALERVRRGAVA
jgi:predicted amidophosphoribosyltransferase